MQPAQPLPEHLWLKKLVGDWTFESEASPGPGKPPIKTTGTESVRSVGDLWFIGEGLGDMPGGGMGTMMITLGYDPDKKRYVGTWLGSMMTYLWVYDGYREGDTLHLEAMGASMSGDGSMAKYRDSIQFLTDDHRTLSSATQNPDGTWNTFMTMHYKRKN